MIIFLKFYVCVAITYAVMRYLSKRIAKTINPSVRGSYFTELGKTGKYDLFISLAFIMDIFLIIGGLIIVYWFIWAEV